MVVGTGEQWRWVGGLGCGQDSQEVGGGGGPTCAKNVVLLCWGPTCGIVSGTVANVVYCGTVYCVV